MAAGCRIGGLLSLARRRNRSSLAILCYHRILPEAERAALPFPDLAVTPQAFAAQVEYCAAHYECLPLHEAAHRLRVGILPRRPQVVFSFDDGYQDNFQYARPILKSQGIRATFFVISSLVSSMQTPWYDRLGRALAYLETAENAPSLQEAMHTAGLARVNGTKVSAPQIVNWAKALDLKGRDAFVAWMMELAAAYGWKREAGDEVMTREQLAALELDGHEIGSHTCSHPILTQLPREELQAELVGSRQELSRIVERPVISLAYPNGDYDAGVLSAAEEAGYRYAVTTRSGLNGRQTHPLCLRRIFVAQRRLARPDGGFSADLLALELSGAADAVFARRWRRRAAG